MIIGLIIMAIGIIALLIGILIINSNAKKREHEFRIKELEKSKEIEEYKRKILEKENDSIRSEGYENRIIELNHRIEEKQAYIKSIDDEINKKSYDLSTIVLKWEYLSQLKDEYSAKLEKIQSERDLTADELKTLTEGLEASKTALQEFSRDIDNLRKEIKDLQEQKRLAILYQDENEKDWWELDIDDKEKSLILILERIKTDYPEIQMDISSIEWRKIWLPKLQDLCNEKDLGCKGIYRLILKKDENVCYVGQAQSIKDRWYQHVKKMIGVDAKGGEKLYKYRPEDFYWTVVERDCKDLNEREHYWIEYFGCKEIGLNKKA